MILHPFIVEFILECRGLGETMRARAELRRLVVECQQAVKAGDRRRARALLRKADRIRAKLET